MMVSYSVGYEMIASDTFCATRGRIAAMVTAGHDDKKSKSSSSSWCASVESRHLGLASHGLIPPTVVVY